MININVGDLFKSVGTFLVKNWQGAGLVIMIVLFFVTKNDYASLKKSMDVMSTSYEEQIAVLEVLHQKELAAREEAMAKFEREFNQFDRKI